MRLCRALKTLPTREIKAVEQLVKFLRSETKSGWSSRVSSGISENSFAKIWDNPEDDIYDVYYKDKP